MRGAGTVSLTLEESSVWLMTSRLSSSLRVWMGFQRKEKGVPGKVRRLPLLVSWEFAYLAYVTTESLSSIHTLVHVYESHIKHQAKDRAHFQS